LSVHAQIEEKIFYPAVKAALKDKLLVPEATVAHASVKDLIAQIEGVEPDGEVYDAKVKATSLDMVDLGTRMAARKAAGGSSPVT
jgi:hypothetical protein